MNMSHTGNAVHIAVIGNLVKLEYFQNTQTSWEDTESRAKTTNLLKIWSLKQGVT